MHNNFYHRDIFEGTISVVTVWDFSIILNSYLQLEESMLANKVERVDLSDDEDGEDDLEDNGVDEDEEFFVYLDYLL